MQQVDKIHTFLDIWLVPHFRVEFHFFLVISNSLDALYLLGWGVVWGA